MLALMQCVSFVIGPSWWDKMDAGPISGGVSYYDAQRYSAILHSVNKLICFYAVHLQLQYCCNITLQYRALY